jgi:hypothetical protein
VRSSGRGGAVRLRLRRLLIDQLLDGRLTVRRNRRIHRGRLATYGMTVGPGRFASGLWKREYVRCTFASSAARPAAGAAAIRPRNLFRFFFRC